MLTVLLTVMLHNVDRTECNVDSNNTVILIIILQCVECEMSLWYYKLTVTMTVMLMCVNITADTH